MYDLPPVDKDIEDEYRCLNGVPIELVDNAVYAKNAEEAKTFAERYVGDRAGYTNHKNMPTAQGGVCTACFITKGDLA